MALSVIPVDPANPTNAEIFEALTELYSAIEITKADVEDIVTASIGSWQWDKTTGVLTMLDTNGNSSFKFEVADSSAEAKRERRQDLE